MSCILWRRAGGPFNSSQSSPYSTRLVLVVAFLAVIPSASCSAGDEFSNNLFTDLSPLLALFGEQVTKQFLSDSMGWADHVLFAMVPLGIITAVVGAIRCGGPRWLKAIIGRAKESRAVVELELMSSTSADVCELWNGHNLVRVIGSPSIMELFYLKDSPSRTHGIYRLEELAIRGTIKVPGLSGGIEMNNLGGNDDESHPLLDADQLPPNISLNAHGSGISSWEMWFWATWGVIIQLGLLVFAGLAARYKGWGRTFSLGEDEDKAPPIWAVALVFVGTLALVAGMMLCCFLIERSSKEKRWEFDTGAQLDVLWLQRGGTVGDQNFGSYAIFARALDRDGIWAKVLAKFFSYSSRRIFVTSHRDLQIDNPRSGFSTSVAMAAFLAMSGFILQFVGMRNLHWSFPVAQLGCTLLLTAIRSWVRRSLFSEPKATEIDIGYELEFLARSLGGECQPWSADWASIKGESGTNGNGLRSDEDIKHQATVDRVFSIRKRLGTLSPWESNCRDITLSLCKAIDGVMKALHETEHIVLKDLSDVNVFTWNVRIHTGTPLEHEVPVGYNADLPIHIKRSRPIDNSLAPWGNWTVDKADLEALLSLLLENKVISRNRAPQARASTSRMLFFSSQNAWERQIFKWWIDHRNLQISGWPQRVDASDGSISLIGSDASSLCAQEVFASFFSEAVNQLVERIEGPAKLRLTERSGLHAFGLSCDVIASLVEVVRDSGIGTEGEAFIAIVDPLAFHRKLPEPKLVIPDIYQRLQNSTLPKPDDAEGFLCHIFKAQVVLYLQLEVPDWESAARFLVEQLQESKPKTIPHTCLTSMLGRLFRQSYVLGESLELSVLRKEACKNCPESSFSLGYPSVQLDDPCPHPPIESHERSMLQECLSKTSGNCLEVALNHLKTATSASYDAVVDFILGLSLDCISRATDLEAFGTSFEIAVEKSNNELIDVFITHLHILAATNSVALDGISAELICSLAVKGFDLAKRLLDSSDIFLASSLQTAAGSGHLNVVNLLLEKGANINARPASDGQTASLVAAGEEYPGVVKVPLLKGEFDGRTALQVAAEGGHFDVVSLLLEKGADVNAPPADRGGQTAIQVAARGGYLDVVKLLLEKGANINAPPASYDGRTALQAAAGGGHLDVVSLLLEQGADIKEPVPYDGRTALQMAAEGGHLDVINLLLDKGANINEPAAGRCGRTALQAAAGSGHLDVVKLLLEKGADVNAPPASYGGRTTLQAAAEGGHLDVVCLLLEEAADVNAPAPDAGRTALQMAAGGDNLDVVKLLLDKGANINAPPAPWGGRTALQAAAGASRLDVINLLLEKGANINALGSSAGRTALQAAAEVGHLDVINLLLGKGADINAPGSDAGQTALQAAARGGHLDVVKLLLGKGANINAPAPDAGRTALQAAAAGGHLDVVKLLLDKGANINSPSASSHHGRTALQAAAEGGHLDVVNLLLEKGANINAPPAASNFGRTALQAAADEGHLGVVKVLLEKGANVNAPPTVSYYGRTALQAAAGGGHLDVINLLLEQGANVNAPPGEREGRTALQAAAEGGHLRVVNLLLEEGADVNAPTASQSGKTALRAALGHHHQDVVDRLRLAGARE